MPQHKQELKTVVERVTKLSDYHAEQAKWHSFDAAHADASESDAEASREAMHEDAQTAADLRALLDLLRSLEGERDEALAANGRLSRLGRAVERERDEFARSKEAAEARVRELEEALKPFAKAADIRLCGEWRDDEHFGQTDVAFYLTFGDLRRARSALHKEAQG